jgi:hypothetical protein
VPQLRGGTFGFIGHTDAGKGEHRDVIDVAGALLVSDPNNARDIIGLGSTWAYLGLEPGIWN